MERTGKRFGLGIDVGGTFTDIVVYDAASGRQASHKELTTHDDPSRGVMAGIDRVLRESAIAPADIGRLVHATTLFSNALIERKGAPTGLITTTGFRDTLEIGRERKYELYDIRIVKPAPLVPRHLRLEVPERMAVDGSVRTPLDEDAVLAAAARLTAEGVTSLAIVFLHSYANPAHERQAAELLAKRYPGLTLSASIEVAPEIREYERVSTTVINAYIKPLAERYIAALSERIAARGIAAPLLLMLSNGGLTNIEEAKRTPVQLLESGPAAGALVAAHLGAADGGKHVLAFDMGGTTAKLSHRRRRQADGRLQLRGRAREALRGGQRPAGAHLDLGADRDRRRRRLHRPSRRHRPAEGRAHQRRLRARPRRLRAWAARSPPSPTPTSCWAISTRPISSAAPWRSTWPRPRRPCGRWRSARA